MIFTIFLLSGYFASLGLLNPWFWNYNSKQKKISFQKSIDHCPLYYLKHHLLLWNLII